jgi:hypothetical protein
MYVCMSYLSVCLHVCMFVCMFVCMCVCIYESTCALYVPLLISSHPNDLFLYSRSCFAMPVFLRLWLWLVSVHDYTIAVSRWRVSLWLCLWLLVRIHLLLMSHNVCVSKAVVVACVCAWLFYCCLSVRVVFHVRLLQYSFPSAWSGINFLTLSPYRIYSWPVLSSSTLLYLPAFLCASAFWYGFIDRSPLTMHVSSWLWFVSVHQYVLLSSGRASMCLRRSVPAFLCISAFWYESIDYSPLTVEIGIQSDIRVFVLDKVRLLMGRVSNLFLSWFLSLNLIDALLHKGPESSYVWVSDVFMSSIVYRSTL